MGNHQPIRKTVAPEIPDKLYFRIGDVARLCEVPTYVLRFWETEFPQLKPNKGGTGQRLYRRRDVELALRIKTLLYDQGYTIPGARQVFKNESGQRASSDTPAQAPVETPAALVATAPVQDSGAILRRQARLRDLREELVALLGILSKPVAASGFTRAQVLESQKLAPEKPEPQLHTMRPRLVLESRPRRDSADGTLPFGARLQKVPPPQRDLFAAELSRDDNSPEPPVAS